jgi:hypothetical protein
MIRKFIKTVQVIKKLEYIGVTRYVSWVVENQLNGHRVGQVETILSHLRGDLWFPTTMKSCQRLQAGHDES